MPILHVAAGPVRPANSKTKTGLIGAINRDPLQQHQVADLLGRDLIAPNSLRAGAGLGRPDFVEACFSPDGTLTPEAGAARGFYRPHSGFPGWRPSTDPQEVLDEALVWACKSSRVAVLERLVKAGARLNADPYRGTPLIWAAVCNRAETVGWLLDHGADIDQKATFGGSTPGQGMTALHLASQYGHRPVVRLLVERGVDRGIKDDLYHATAAGGAGYFGKHDVRDYLNSFGVEREGQCFGSTYEVATSTLRTHNVSTTGREVSTKTWDHRRRGHLLVGRVQGCAASGKRTPSSRLEQNRFEALG